MNFLPLWTASVCPTISGITVDRRDQVLSTFFSNFLFMASMVLARNSSTKGPFLTDRAIDFSSPPAQLINPSHNHLVSPLVITGLESTRRLSPGCHGVAS